MYFLLFKKEQIRIFLFFGNDARNAFNDYIDSKYGIIRWTDKLLNAQGELDFACMEKPKSIHLSREHYPYWNGVEPDAMSQSLESFFG